MSETDPKPPRPNLAQLAAQLCPALAEPALWPILEQHGSWRQVEAGSKLIEAGQNPKHIYVVYRGLLRQFYLGNNGREHNKNFFREGQLAGSISAWLSQGPCPFDLQAIENCLLLQVPVAPLQAAQPQQAPVRRMIEVITRDLFLRNEQREALLLRCGGEARYRWLCQHESWLLERLPQYQLASYLGMDAVSLSRIKAKLERANN